MRRRHVATLVVATGLAVPSLAHADLPPGPRQEHGPTIDRDLAIEPRDVTCAPNLKALEEQYEESRDVELLREIARCSETVGDDVTAVVMLKRYLGAAVAEERRAEVAEVLGRLEPRLAHMTVTSNVDGIEVRVDGRCAIDATSYAPTCVARESEREVLVNPGERRLSITRTGYRQIAQTLTMNPGERVRVRADATRLHEEPNPYRDPMWTAWGVTAGAGVATTIVGLRTAFSGEGIQSSTGIATLALGGVTLIAAGVATYFTVRASRWKPPVETTAEGLRVRF